MISGNILDLSHGDSYPAEIEIQNGKITCVREVKKDFDHYLLPGFIDAHIHIESSLLTPSRFSEAVTPHGTTSVVADPHEIANVLGLKGIYYMMDDSSNVPLRFYYTAPSCVPATFFETSGAILGYEEIEKLMKDDRIVALGEMMNFPGVVGEDPQVLSKINISKKYKKPIDGHAPLLSGEDLCKYIATGISTDHECTTAEEAFEKKRLGMKIMIREGSSAKNMSDLLKIGGYFLVSDDKHPEDLIKGHMNLILRNAVDLGLDPFEAVKMVTIHPAEHYNLEIGDLTPGKPADIVSVGDLKEFDVHEVIIGGELVAKDGKALFNVKPRKLKSTIISGPKKPSDFEIKADSKEVKVRVIKVLEGQLLTLKTEHALSVEQGIINADLDNDVLKISVINRYQDMKVSNAFVNGFGLKSGAIASSVAHDSHNLIVVGTNAQDMADAANSVIECGGGLVAISKNNRNVLKLPIAGLMSNDHVDKVSKKLEELRGNVQLMGCELESPYMTLSFLSLLVIPQLKLSDKGLFDGENFELVEVVK
jgi:adenine deaminase